jgi:hypothetical protein
VAEAGWQPVTYAEGSDPDVWVERFGPGEDGAVYLTVFNGVAEERACTINCPVQPLGLRPGEAIVDITDGSTVATVWDGVAVDLQVSVGPEQVRVLQLRAPAGE